MIKLKLTARILGILFLLSAFAGIMGISLNGLPLPFDSSPNALHTVFENSFQINLSILCDVIANVFLIAVAVLLYPVLSKLNRLTALWYFGFGVIGFTVMLEGSISISSLLSLCQEYAKPGMHDPAYFQTLAVSKQAEYFGAHFMSLIVYSLGASPFYYIAYTSRLIPRFLSAWGLVAATLVLIVTWLQIFGQEVSLLFYLPNGLFILFLGGWLIIKGFNAA
jgi:hypothetical protein